MSERTAVRRWVLVVWVVLFASGAAVFAQDASISDWDDWFDLATIYDASDRFRYDGDYGLRGSISKSSYTQFYIRPSVRYEVQPWFLVHGGLGWFHTNLEGQGDVDELRPWGGLRFLGPSPGGFAFTHYLRLEYRAFYRGDDADKRREQVWRGRYQLQVATPEFKIGAAERFRAVLSVEPLKTFGVEVDGLLFSQFRVNAGIGKQVHERLTIQFNYLFQRSRLERAGGNVEVDDHILRLRFFYRLNRS